MVWSVNDPWSNEIVLKVEGEEGSGRGERRKAYVEQLRGLIEQQ